MNPTWLQKHERLILILVGLAVAAWLGNGWLNRSAAVADARAQAAQQTLQAQVVKNDEWKTFVAQQTADYKALVEQLALENKTLIQSIQARAVELQKRQQTAATAPITEVTLRWQALLGLQPEDVQKTDAGVQVTDLATRTTVQQLERVPTLEADLTDGKVLVANKDRQLGELTGVWGDSVKQVQGLQAELVAKDASCKADLAAVKAAARKSKRNWFVGGILTGITIAVHIIR